MDRTGGPVGGELETLQDEEERKEEEERMGGE